MGAHVQLAAGGRPDPLPAELGHLAGLDPGRGAAGRARAAHLGRTGPAGRLPHRRRPGRGGRAGPAGRRHPVAGAGHADRARPAPCRPTPASWCCRTRKARRSPSLAITERSPADADGTRCAWRARSPRCARPSTGRSGRCGRRPPRSRGTLGAGPVLAYATRRPLGQRQIGQLRHLAGQLRARILLLPLVAGPGRARRPARGAGPRRLRRRRAAAGGHAGGAGAAAAAGRPGGGAARRGPWSRPPTGRPTCWPERGPRGCSQPRSRSGGRWMLTSAKLGIEILAEGEWAYDPAAEVWRPLRPDRAGPGARRAVRRRARRAARLRGRGARLADARRA